MILASVLDLKVLRWQTGLAIAMPYRIGEQTFQGDFMHASGPASSSESAFVAAFEH